MGPFFGSYRSRKTNRQRGIITAFRDYDECARVWVRQSQDEGHTPQSRMYFSGSTIYSYGSHFPLARIVYALGNVAYVLVNRGRYGPTTSTHQRAVRSAIDSYMGLARSVFYVDTKALQASDHMNGKYGISAVFDSYSHEFKSALDTAAKPRIRHATRDAALASAKHAASEANRYADLFGEPRPFPRCEAEAFALMLFESALQQEAA